MNRPVQLIKLASGSGEMGLTCHKDGLTLAGHPLLEHTWRGLSPRAAADIQDILDTAYGADSDLRADSVMPGLASIARFLNKGDLPLAMIGSVLLKLPEIPDWSPLRQAAADLAEKAGYDSEQPRDDHGRWTQGFGSGAAAPPSQSHQARDTNKPFSPDDIQLERPLLPPEASPALAPVARPLAARAATWLAEAAPRVLVLAADFAEAVAFPVAIAGAVLFPTNRSNITFGDVPDAPGLTYRSDEGVVTIFGRDGSGNVVPIYEGLPDKDGFYHDDQGLIIGRHVGTAVMFDSEALQEIASSRLPAAALQDAGTGGGGISGTSVIQDDDEPQACPNPTPENIKGRSKRSLAYQTQITGLPPGLDVLYHTVRFDGCDEQTGRMIEAKGLGMEWMLNWPDDKLVNSRFYQRMMRQAQRQNNASSDRGDDWYFADQRMAAFFSAEFRYAGYSNIKVHWREAIIKKLEECIAWIKRNLDLW